MTTAVPARPAVGNCLKSVAAALALLDCFGSDGELGVTDVAGRLGVAKSTAHRLLSTLCASGLVERNPETARYRLGLHLFELGQLAVTRFRLTQAALPLLEELRQRTGFTVHLAVRDGVDVLYVKRLQSLNGMHLFADVPYRFPGHCTASGRAIAAFNTDFARLREAAGLPSPTSSTIRTRRDWHRTIEEVRSRGIAFNRNEVMTGLTSVGAPVRDHAGRSDAAVSVVGPTGDVIERIERVARLVALTAERIGRDADGRAGCAAAPSRERSATFPGIG